MENLENQQEKNRIEELREIIDNQPARLEAEYNRTANTWLECFVTSLFIIETNYDSSKLAALMPKDKYQKGLEQLDELKKEVRNLMDKFPNKETDPPEELMDRLFNKLDVLKS